MSYPRRVVASLLAIVLLGALTFAFASSAQAAGGTGSGWGENSYGQAAAPPTKFLGVATPIGGLSEVVQVASGGSHSLALLADGTVRAWGFNLEGQLGIGGVSGPELCNTYSCSTKPIPVPGLSNVVAVAAGEYDSYALLANGTVMSWGENAHGQLGIGSSLGPEKCNGYECSAKPVAIPGLGNVIAIAARGSTIVAVLADGSVVTWGYGRYGELGNGEVITGGCACIDHPVLVSGVANAVAAAVSEFGGSALLADGTEMSWGFNSYGELGTGALSDGPGCECLGAVPVSGLSGVREIAVGNTHRLALLGDGSVKGWGSNVQGQLGTGGPTAASCSCELKPTAVVGLASPQAVDAAGDFSLALLADGSGASWGYGSIGQLGGGSADEERFAPGPVKGLSGASEIDAGGYHVLATVGSSQTLNVALAGAGTGTVGAMGIVCPAANCATKVPQGQTKILRASSTAGGFAGFSGPCTGTGICQVKMETDQTVTATFGVPKGTALTKSDVNSKKKKATFAFSAPGAITGYECKLIKPKTKKKKGKGKGKKSRIELAKKGAKKPKAKPPTFASCTGPAAYKNLKPGKYTFEVRALDILGADATPAVEKFQIKKPKPKKKRKR